LNNSTRRTLPPRGYKDQVIRPWRGNTKIRERKSQEEYIKG